MRKTGTPSGQAFVTSTSRHTHRRMRCTVRTRRRVTSTSTCRRGRSTGASVGCFLTMCRRRPRRQHSLRWMEKPLRGRCARTGCQRTLQLWHGGGVWLTGRGSGNGSSSAGAATWSSTSSTTGASASAWTPGASRASWCLRRRWSGAFLVLGTTLGHRGLTRLAAALFRWDYNVTPAPGSPEERTVQVLRSPLDWLAR